jgi:ABC-type transport system involved in cytochrome c biogenesis permease component
VVFLAGGLPFAGAIWASNTVNLPVPNALLLPSPGYAAVTAFDAAFKAGSAGNYFFQSLGLVHGMSWAFLAAAAWIVPRTWHDQVQERGRWAKPLERIEHGTPGTRVNARRRLLAVNPILWLSARHRMKAVAVWALLATGAAIWAVGLLRSPLFWKDESLFVWTSLLTHWLLKFWIATEASRRFSLDRRNGALELILSTPLSVRDVVGGQAMALEWQFGRPMLVVLLADFVFMMAGERSTDSVVVWVIWMVVLVADLLALSWVGMWRGLNSRRPNRAAAGTLARILLLPWILFLMVEAGLAILEYSVRSRSSFESFYPVALWGLIALGTDVVLGLSARRRLLGDFRVVAAGGLESTGAKAHGS